MMNPLYLILLGLIAQTTAYKISPRCVEVCKAESSIRCSKPCARDAEALSSLSSVYGRGAVDSCTTACRCDEREHVYSATKDCQVMQSLVVRDAGRHCECDGGHVWQENLNKWQIQNPPTFLERSMGGSESRGDAKDLFVDSSTMDPVIENWCKEQCAKGMGGKACLCDILP